MASGTLAGGADASREKHRWSESKVYTRKTHNKTKKPKPSPNPNQILAPSATDEALSQSQPNPNRHLFDSSAASNGGDPPKRRSVTISLASCSRDEGRELRRKLGAELDQVRSLINKLEARELQLSRDEASNPLSDRRQFSVSVLGRESATVEAVEKEKRTPKANKFYRNSEFILGKEKFPPADTQKSSKGNGTPTSDKKLYGQAFKSCGALLSKLMKHEFAWVFNTPVDAKGLGLHDYYTIIKQPMDLGTVKSRLNKNWYKTPEEFAEDVRLTFRNAMTYNPKGQDVHFMAEQLLPIFEGAFHGRASIKADYTHLLNPPFAKKAAPPVDKRTLEKSDSTAYHVVVDSKANTVNHPHPPHVGRSPAPKKPKAKDLHKRNMTFEEKHKLSNNLQNLPPEKLDAVAQLIKRKNLSTSQHNDEIEVDIDSVDPETLWELDRFVTNYKKSLSKNKRKAELSMLSKTEVENDMQPRVEERVPDNMAVELAKESRTVTGEKKLASSKLVGGENKENNTASGSSTSSSSSSNSGSSSTGSDSGSSSAYGSGAGNSPRT